MNALRYGNYKKKNLNKLISELLNKKTLVIKICKKIIKKLFDKLNLLKKN